MNTTSSQVIKLGAFVIGGILILLVGIFLIGSKKNMFSSTYGVYGIFKNAGGLKAGNNVRFGGVDVGTIQRITIVKDTIVRVDIIIKTKMSEFIKTDAVATIGSDGLMGDKLLEIEPGSPNAKVLAAGGQMRTQEPVDFGGIINKFSTVADNATVITGALADMALEIKHGDGSISRLLYRNDLALGLEGTLNNAKSITSSLDDIALHIQSGQGSLGALVYTDSLSNNLNRTVSSANAALATVQVAANNFGEDMRALQSSFLFKKYFKKKAKAEADSAKSEGDDEPEMNDAELQQIKDDADKELQRRHTKTNITDTIR